MSRAVRLCQWTLANAILLALGGCVTSAQYGDFLRTEFARTISNVIGQAVAISAQGST